jgi:hypothetical protein
MPLLTTLSHHLRKNLNRIRIILNAVVDCLTYYLAPKKQIDISKEGYETFLFLCHDLPPHFPRMVKWMQRNMKLHPVLVVVKRGEFSEFNIEYFEQIFTYRTIWQLRRLLSGLKGYDLMYTSGAVAWPMRTGIEVSDTVIFDVKDTYIVNYGFHPPQLYMKLDLKNEKYAFMHADVSFHKVLRHSLLINTMRYPGSLRRFSFRSIVMMTIWWKRHHDMVTVRSIWYMSVVLWILVQ